VKLLKPLLKRLKLLTLRNGRLPDLAGLFLLEFSRDRSIDPPLHLHHFLLLPVSLALKREFREHQRHIDRSPWSPSHFRSSSVSRHLCWLPKTPKSQWATRGCLVGDEWSPWAKRRPSTVGTCTGPELKFTQDNVPCVEVLLMPAAQRSTCLHSRNHVIGKFWGQAVCASRGAPHVHLTAVQSHLTVFEIAA